MNAEAIPTDSQCPLEVPHPVNEGPRTVRVSSRHSCLPRKMVCLIEECKVQTQVQAGFFLFFGEGGGGCVLRCGNLTLKSCSRFPCIYIYMRIPYINKVKLSS